MVQSTAVEQLRRSTEHCYRAGYDTTLVPCAEKALLQSMLHSSTPMRFSLSESIAKERATQLHIENILQTESQCALRYHGKLLDWI